MRSYLPARALLALAVAFGRFHAPAGHAEAAARLEAVATAPR